MAAGVQAVFCVPGESFLGLLDALYDRPDVRVVPTRHEGAAAFMAAAYARMTSTLGVCMATRMVGAANLAIGIHAAQQDGTPLLALLGQVPRAFRHREALQEADLEAIFRPLTKLAVEARDSAEARELIHRAARIAVTGRPGAAMVAVPEDLGREPIVAGADLPPIRVPRPEPSPKDLAAVDAVVQSARRPLLLLGEEVLAGDGVAAAVAVSERHGLPAVTAWRRPDAFPNYHPAYLGSTGLGAPSCVAEALERADAVLAVGARLDQLTTSGFTLPRPRTSVVLVAADPATMGGHHPVTVAVTADAAAFLRAFSARPPTVRDGPAWLDEAARFRARWERATTPEPASTGGPGVTVTYEHAMAVLRKHLPADAVITSDAGNFSGWLSRYLWVARSRTFLGSISGAMGYALPAAIGAKLACPDRPAVAVAGDGGMLMTGSELETSVREHLPITVVVFDNQRYGTIRMHQERSYPGRPLATELGPVDFAAYARSLGARGVTATGDDFEEALIDALTSERTTVIHARADPEQVSVHEDD